MSFLDFKEEDKIDYQNLSDESLLSTSIKDPEAYAVLINRYQGAFLRKSRSILRSQEDSEDVVQETFTKIYLNASKFQEQEGASFKSWGYKILVNTSFTRYQKLKKKRENIAELTETMSKVVEDPYSANALEKKEMTDYIARAMTELPKALSRILHLHFIERRPQKQIAQMENLSVGAVKTRIYRAKKEFRKMTKHPITNIY
jgi:RNA polymerase sigma-70 factor, ECF subfamily